MNFGELTFDIPPLLPLAKINKGEPRAYISAPSRQLGQNGTVSAWWQ